MATSPQPTPPGDPVWAALVAAGSDFDLLQLMAEQDRDRTAAEAAFREFYIRHVDFLYRICRRICVFTLHDPNLTEDLLHDTMWEVFRTADKFDKTKVGSDDADRMRLAVRRWIARRARWALRALIRRNQHRPLLRLFGMSSPDLLEQGLDESHEQRDEVMMMIDRLPERERRVLMLTVLLRDPDTGVEVDEEEMDVYAARRLGITPEYVRQIRRRAIRDLREMFNPAASDK